MIKIYEAKYEHSIMGGWIKVVVYLRHACHSTSCELVYKRKRLVLIHSVEVDAPKSYSLQALRQMSKSVVSRAQGRN